MALSVVILLTIVLGGFDMLLCASAKSSVTWVAQQSANCTLQPTSCNVAAYSQNAAAGVALNPAQLSCSVAGPNTVTCTYVYQAFGFAWPPTVTLTSTAVAIP